MFRELVEKKLTSFHTSFDSWEDAIKASFNNLKLQEYVDDAYIESVIQDVKTYGPYIVIAPYIAMPHSVIGSKGVSKDGISFMKVKNKVSFDSEKDATIFFSFAAINEDQHLKNMVLLAETLMNKELLKDLYSVESDEDLIALDIKYNLK